VKLLLEGIAVIRKPLIPLAVLALAACATTDPPAAEIGAARAMVAQARPLADRDAPQQIAEAQAKLSRAESEMQKGHHDTARMLARQAEADAKLAWTIAENARLSRTAAEVQDANRTLREESERKSQ
jgi:hypothetical protein